MIGAELVGCPDGSVRSLVGLSLAPEHRRGSAESGCRATLPKEGGRIRLAVDVSPWLRPDAGTSPERAFCHTYGRGKDQHLMVPGWPYSVVAALETGRTSWTALLDAVRLPPGADVAAVTTDQ